VLLSCAIVGSQFRGLVGARRCTGRKYRPSLAKLNAEPEAANGG